jgi:hypothetical protein
VRRGDRDRLGLVADGAALRDVGVGDLLGQVLQALHLHERGRERRLAVVDVTDRADVHVGLRPVEFLFGHREVSSAPWFETFSSLGAIG